MLSARSGPELTCLAAAGEHGSGIIGEYFVPAVGDDHHASEYIRAEEQARRERRGLWRQGNPQPPWEFRMMLNKGDSL